MEKKCFYCNHTYEKDSEHVFPDGLGGEKMYMTCVCNKCNNDFSKLERELYQKGIPGLIRSVEGLTKQKNLNNPTYFKAPVLFVFDEVNKIVYEVNQSNHFKISLKPQIIEINDKIYIEGSDSKSIEKLVQEIKRWKVESPQIVTRFPNSKKRTTSYIEFQINEDNISHSEFESSKKNNRNSPFLVLLEKHELSKYLKPRIFLDAQGNLKIRAKNIADCISFITSFLRLLSKPVKLKSFSKTVHDNGIVYVGLNFKPLEKERAMVKIMLNAFIHYFPKSKESPSLELCKSFIVNGVSGLRRAMDESNPIIDSIKNSHNIFFHQYGENFHIRLSLFNGQLCYKILIPQLQVFENLEYKRLVIHFKKRKNIMEGKNEFLSSYAI